MNGPSTAAPRIVFRFRTVLFALLMLAPIALKLAAQSDPSRAPQDSALAAHFAAAQQAQRDKDYNSAEREYQAVVAIAPDFAEAHMNLGLVYQLQDRKSVV